VRFHRIVGLLVATAAAVLMAPAAAWAKPNPDPYPAGEPDSSVSDGTVSDGDAVTFWGKGFLPFERISIKVVYESSDDTAALERQPAGGFILAAAQLPRRAGLTTTADADGEFSVRLRLTKTGLASLVATGLTSGVTVTESVHVVISPGTVVSGGQGSNGGSSNNGHGLAVTGPSGAPFLIALCAGAGAVLLGAALLWLTRRRARKSAV